MYKTLTNTLTYILITLILIFVLQIFYTSQLQSANLYLQKESQKVKVIEKTVLGFKECICPKCPERWTELPAE